MAPQLSPLVRSAKAATRLQYFLTGVFFTINYSKKSTFVIAGVSFTNIYSKRSNVIIVSEEAPRLEADCSTSHLEVLSIYQ
jgi:hypothetical protein